MAATGRPMRWRIWLSEFDFTISYMPGRVHQVANALSRPIPPYGTEENTIKDEIPTFGQHDEALVTTRKRAANTSETHGRLRMLLHDERTVEDANEEDRRTKPMVKKTMNACSTYSSVTLRGQTRRTATKPSMTYLTKTSIYLTLRWRV